MKINKYISWRSTLLILDNLFENHEFVLVLFLLFSYQRDKKSSLPRL